MSGALVAVASRPEVVSLAGRWTRGGPGALQFGASRDHTRPREQIFIVLALEGIRADADASSALTHLLRARRCRAGALDSFAAYRRGWCTSRWAPTSRSRSPRATFLCAVPTFHNQAGHTYPAPLSAWTCSPRRSRRARGWAGARATAVRHRLVPAAESATVCPPGFTQMLVSRYLAGHDRRSQLNPHTEASGDRRLGADPARSGRFRTRTGGRASRRHPTFHVKHRPRLRAVRPVHQLRDALQVFDRAELDDDPPLALAELDLHACVEPI